MIKVGWYSFDLYCRSHMIAGNLANLTCLDSDTGDEEHGSVVSVLLICDTGGNSLTLNRIISVF